MGPSVITTLDRVHAAARTNPALVRLAGVARVLLAIAFVPTGLVKLLGERFTTAPDTSPIGYFFEAMYRTGGYWRFLGLAQIVAGTLLVIPPLATLGAVLFFPIMLNVFVITVALHFHGTPIVTGLMLLANVFLPCWDYDRLKPILFAPARRPVRPALRFGVVERAAFALCGLAGLMLLLTTRSLLPRTVMIPALAAGAFGTMVLLVVWGRLFAQSARPISGGRADGSA